ncbi:FG-GAP repeat protein [Eilatimonas milleporae]|uniref:FG-GAP repeat protein n=1 Tax=Eilatimonas milleporae TaxID=911205 RepID=A0A3M0D7J0_9PROT|nr:FG-GAP repeat protein [Eilatimonas milleporae]RMB12233.1 FG-GAP repeat protein [Eilatimonas milleporae]
MPSFFNLSNLNGSNGFVLNGLNDGDNFGTAVSTAGDINGDEIDDIVIGASVADPSGRMSAGQSFVVFGHTGNFSSDLDLSDLNGNNGFVVNGINPGDFLGDAVSTAGDINNDGIDDLIIGAPLTDVDSINSAGASYVIFGKGEGFDTFIDLTALDGNNGFVINGIDEGNNAGIAVSTAGDINGDDIDDIIIGASRSLTNFPGQSYVIFGRAGGFDADFNASTLDGTTGFIINSIIGDDLAGEAVGGAGDINGDGFDDLVIGAFTTSTNENKYVGETFVVFGGSSTFSPTFDLATLNGNNGFSIQGQGRYDVLGASVSLDGDINGDGLNDLIVTAPSADAGQAYVIFGTTAGFNASLAPSDLDGNNGFVITSIDAVERFGGASATGDINGDGIDDIIVSASSADPFGNTMAGKTYIVFGQTEGFGARLDLSTLDGDAGFTINGINAYDRSGHAISIAGDINGDGFDDLIIGAPNAATGTTNAGAAYVVFGGSALAPTVSGLTAQSAAQNAATRIDLTTVSVSEHIAGNPVTLTIMASDTGAVLKAADGSNLGVTATDDGNNMVTLVGTAANITAYLDGVGNITYTGSGNTAQDTLSLQVSDGIFPTQEAITATVTLAPPPNIAPSTANGSAALDAGATYVFTTSDFAFSDADGGDFAAIRIDGLPDIGALTLLGSAVDAGQVISLSDIAVGQLVYTADARGADSSFSFRVSDGAALSSTARFSLTVTDPVPGDGSGGNDPLGPVAGSPGDDILIAGDTDDTIRGQEGNDEIRAGGGNDRIVAGLRDDGNDTLFGGNGNDTVGGGVGDDDIDGGNDNDLLFGGAGNDAIFGGDDDDTIFNGTGNDTANGGNGNDTLWGGAGDDILAGGTGSDTFIFGQTSGNDRIVDFDIGADILNLRHAPAQFQTLSDVSAAARLVIDGANGNPNLVIDIGDGQSVILAGLIPVDISDMTIVL